MDDQSEKALRQLVTVAGSASLSIGLIKAVFEYGAKSANTQNRALIDAGIAVIESQSQILARFEDVAPKLGRAIHAHGLIIPVGELDADAIQQLVALHESGDTRGAIGLVEEAYTRLFATPNFLDALRASWKDSKLVAPRWAILDHALRAHDAGLFGASIPAMLSQVEGIVVTLRQHTKNTDKSVLDKLFQEVTRDDKIAGRLLVQFFRHVLWQDFAHGKDSTRLTATRSSMALTPILRLSATRKSRFCFWIC